MKARTRRLLASVLGAAVLAATSVAAAAQVTETPKAAPPQAAPPKAGEQAPGQAPGDGPMSRGRPGFDYWQPDWMVRELWGPGRMPKGMMTRLLRHSTYMHYGVPKAYEGATSSISGPEAVAAGSVLYQRHCASCHGRDGLGDGAAENALSPSPALLAFMIRRPVSVDEYLLWTIADGGDQFGSAMPAFKDTLAREDIWRIVAYMRSGFPAVDKDGKSLPPARAK